MYIWVYVYVYIYMHKHVYMLRPMFLASSMDMELIYGFLKGP